MVTRNMGIYRVHGRSWLTRLLCALLGGHSWSLPTMVDGKLCLRCQYDCGATTRGVVLHEPRRVVYLNLRVMRSASRKVA